VFDEAAEQLLAVAAPMEHRGNYFGCEEIHITTKLQ
jgi:hypothetical protein